MAVDQQRAARLKWARESDGRYPTPTDAAQVFGRTYFQYENGTRGFEKHVRRFARHFRVREDWLRHGSGLPKDTIVSIILGGIVGSYGIINSSDSGAMDQSTLGEVIAEPPVGHGDYIAYKVDGDTNYPALFNGDVIYASKAVDPTHLLGKQCVATLSDGTKRICILARGAAEGLFMLLSINATPVPDVQVIEAEPVVWIRRG